MKTLASVLILATAQLAHADCLPPIDGSLDVVAEPISCKVIKTPAPETGTLLEIAVRNSKVALRCNVAICRGSEHYEFYIRHLNSQSQIFSEASEQTTCSKVMAQPTLKARVVVQCCDTLPHEGTCSLNGPLVKLKT
jgi:hypothetical protein